VSFLAPLFLLGAAAAAVPIVLHLLKREPEARVKFAAVRLLQRGPVEHTQRRRLRELLLLALRVAALLLLAIAFARPFFAGETVSSSAGVSLIALDTSLSVSAPGQFERAKQIAREAIGRVPPGDLVGVVTFADQAHIAVAPTPDRGLALSAIDAAATGFGATRYLAALNQAADLLRGRRGTITVVTDLQESGWDAGDRAAVPESAQIVVADIGAPPPNLAVTAVRTAADRVVATIRNAGPTSREARVRLTVDDRPAGEGSATIAAGQSSAVTLPGARGAAASVSVDDPGGVPSDNVRYLVTGPATQSAVLVVTATGDLTRDAFYVAKALSAEGADGPAYHGVGASGAEISTWDPGRLGAHRAVLVMSTRGLERSGRQLLAGFVRQGGGILVAAGPQVDGEVASDALEGAFTLADLLPVGAAQDINVRRTLAPADSRHPLFESFGPSAASLGLPRFDRIAAIGGAACQVLARFTTGEAALLDCTPGEGRLLVFASDLDRQWNDFPRHATFVPFLHEAVRYLGGDRVHAAEYLVGRTPPGVAAEPGLATVRDANGSLRRIAVNVDPAESDPARLTPEEFQDAVTRIQDAAQAEGRIEDRQHEDRQHLWQYVLGAMLALMLAESFLASRTA
jgi:hypothetical protein